MNKLKLDANALEVTSYETVKVAAVSVPAMTGTTGYCNTCMPTACNWTV